MKETIKEIRIGLKELRRIVGIRVKKEEG